MKKYPTQCGPNLVFYDCQNEPEGAVMHKGCGGMLAQILGPANQRSCEKPDDTPGRVFCYECGHKVSRAVAKALRTEEGRHQFYFPQAGKDEYYLRSRTLIDANGTVRYWEWAYGKNPGLGEKAKRAIDVALKKLRNKQRLTRAVSTKPMYVLEQPRLHTPLRPFNAQGPFGGNCDMASREGKYIISYKRQGMAAMYWFLVLNKDIWGQDHAQEIRDLVRKSTFSTPEHFLDKMAAHARAREAPTNGDSFQITSSLDAADDINF